MVHPDFVAAFEDGRRLVDYFDRELRLRPQVLGELVVPSGQIVACNPLTMVARHPVDGVFPALADIRPFVTTVAPGRYPVVGSLATFEDGREVVACAMLRIHDRPAVRWELAICEGQEAASVQDDADAGYGVDETGTGCFMDAVAAHILMARFHDLEAFNAHFEAITGAFRRTYRRIRAWADIPVDPTTGANLIVFTSGKGDGIYPSYFGYDAKDVIVSLITDFGILPAEHGITH